MTNREMSLTDKLEASIDYYLDVLEDLEAGIIDLPLQHTAELGAGLRCSVVELEWALKEMQ